MTAYGHAPATQLINTVTVATPATMPVNVTNAQDTWIEFDNVQISSPKGHTVS